MTIERVTALVSEILDRRHERDEAPLMTLLAELVCEAVEIGRAPRRKGRRSADVRAQAVAEYREGRGTLDEIAARHGISKPGLHRWVTKAGARRRAA